MSEKKSVPDISDAPICPYCSRPMGEVKLFHWVSSPWLVMDVHCPHCRKNLHIQVVPLNAAGLAPAPAPESGPRLIS